jgi:Mor family transcriptional regulator
MTVEQVNKKLISARLKRAKINDEIKALNEMLKRKKMDGHSLRERRNKEIYKLFLKGKPIKEIALRYKLSPESTRMICERMEMRQKKEDKVNAWIERNSK